MTFDIVSVEERTLAANQGIEKAKRLKWTVTDSTEPTPPGKKYGIMWLRILKNTSCLKTQFWVIQWCKVKIWSQGRFWNFTYFVTFISFQVTLRIWCKNVVFILLCKNGLLNCYCVPFNTLPRFLNFERLFLKIKFVQTCCNIISKNLKISRMQCPIWKLCVPKLGWKKASLVYLSLIHPLQYEAFFQHLPFPSNMVIVHPGCSSV